MNLNSHKKAIQILFNNNLYAITNQKENLIEIIENLLMGGVRIIQHRFKEGNDKDHLKEANEIKKLCKI